MFVRRVLSGREASHGFLHACAVRDLSMEIFRKTDIAGARLGSVVEIAAMLHDVLDHKYVDTSTPEGRKLADEVDAFLNEELDEEGGCAVRDIVKNVSYSKENKARMAGKDPPWKALKEPVLTMRHVVSDADKIEALGEGGLQRCFECAREFNPEADERGVLSEVLQHCQDKLLRLLPEFIRTDAGKAMARPGHEFLADWVDSHNRDTRGGLTR